MRVEMGQGTGAQINNTGHIGFTRHGIAPPAGRGVTHAVMI
jgi:hypothetical protein